jgi:GH15 family glucan-1,4-alpha-glucosidase
MAPDWVIQLPDSTKGKRASGRNWDYRFCWLRDSYFVVHTLNALGVTRTMEIYLNYTMNIVATSEDGYLQPVFGIVQDKRLDEAVVDSLIGYRAMGPVRVGNDAFKQVQNDGYGSVISVCTQMFFDQRLYRKGDTALFQRLEKLGAQAARRWKRPGAGMWELRSRKGVHIYSNVMCWAACDRRSDRRGGRRAAEASGVPSFPQPFMTRAITGSCCRPKRQTW